MSRLLEKLFTLGPRVANFMDYAEAKRLASDPNESVRRKLAARADVQPEILYYLTDDPAPRVRREIAANSATPVQADALLARDGDDEVRCCIARKVSRLAPKLSADEQDKIGDIVVGALQTLAEDELPRVREILAETLKDVDGVPADVIERLARDDEISVSGPVLEHSPLLSDEFLLEIIASHPVNGALRAISRRTELKSIVADAIVDADDEDAITALLGNMSAQIREETLDRLVERAENFPAWHEPLVARPRLSQRAIRRLSEIVADSLLRKLQKRHDIDAETATIISAKVRQRLDREPRMGGDMRNEDVDESPEERACRLDEAGTLDEDALLAALGKGDRAFVVAALALRSGLPAAAIEKIVSLASAKGMTALVWKAGMSMKLAEQLQLRLSRIKPSAILKRRSNGRFPMSTDEMTWQLEFFMS